MNVNYALFGLLGYFIGSIPTGVLFARAKGIDLFKFGSGNIGATNVTRALGPRIGKLVFILDIAKGYAPAIIAILVTKGQLIGVTAGLTAVLGHSFSPFLRFKGGKGVATSLGAVLAFDPLLAGITFAVFLVMFAVTRIVSISSLVAACVLSIMGFVLPHHPVITTVYCVLFLFLLFRHRENVVRLVHGKEKKLDLSSQKEDANE